MAGGEKMKRKILLIDDEKTFTQVLRFNLEETKRFTIRVEHSGREVIRVAREFKPDLIILDIMMPGMPGDKAAHQLKNNDDTKNIPIIFLTAIMTTEETGKRDNALGDYIVVAKPVDIDKLIAIIDRTLG